jgi:UDP-glucose 4-epimerase
MVLFSAMAKYGVNKIVFSSSAAVYAASNISPCTEESKLGTLHPYATTKLIIEYLLQDIAKNSQLKAIALRYFNPI